jgi:hypothetical protein
MHRQLNFDLIQRRVVSQQIEKRMGVCGPHGMPEHMRLLGAGIANSMHTGPLLCAVGDVSQLYLSTRGRPAFLDQNQALGVK